MSDGDMFIKRPGQVPYRNPKRIPHMINLLSIAWAQDNMTDMRLGQLIMNAARHGGWASNDVWNCEDEVFAKGFLEMLKGVVDTNA